MHQLSLLTLTARYHDFSSAASNSSIAAGALTVPIGEEIAL
jgi:hypothetical protein